MADTSLEKLLQLLAEIVFSIDRDVADMRASIAALKAVLATQLSQADPSIGAAHIDRLEKVAREADPTAEQRKQLADVIEAIKMIQKHGSHDS
jgi:hypothetical protein